MPEALTHTELLKRCQGIIKVGSKSFSMASRVFGKEKRDGALLLYAWCRFCDDEIDRAAETASSAELSSRLEWLRQQTRLAFEGNASKHPIFQALQFVAHKHQIPDYYAFELLNGMEMDIQKKHYRDFEELKLYCYRVAGVVGLMMTHIMGCNEERALQHACDMGTAMQLTNIARDVAEDASLGRVYLPETWLNEQGLTSENLLNSDRREALVVVGERLLTEADRFYQSGDAGLKHLSLRCACTIAVARNIYSDIGRRIRFLGKKAWDQRVWVPTGRKLVLMVSGISRVLATVPSRILSPWRAVTLTTIWRHS